VASVKAGLVEFAAGFGSASVAVGAVTFFAGGAGWATA